MTPKAKPEPGNPPKTRYSVPALDVDIQRQRVNAGNKIAPQRVMHRAVALNAGLAGKTLRPDTHVEVAFTALAVSGMATMAFAVIHHLQRGGVKGGLQPGPDFFGDVHVTYLRQKLLPHPLLSGATYSKLWSPSRKEARNDKNRPVRI